jgi:hypothetical protein
VEQDQADEVATDLHNPLRMVIDHIPTLAWAWRRRSPTPSSTRPEHASATCRSRSTSCCEDPGDVEREVRVLG